MIALKSVIPSDLTCYSVTGRSSALPDRGSYVAKFLQHEKRNDRPKSTESMFRKGIIILILIVYLLFFLLKALELV